jgi:hypothetical protein
MQIRGIKILVFSFFVLMWGWHVPQPAMAWSYGYRTHTGYGHYGHRRYNHHSYYRNNYYTHHRYGYSYRNYDHHYFAYDGRSSVRTALREGWNYLIKGYSRDALDRFVIAAQANPSSGAAKVGYALATADLGRLDKGVWAMRRALRIDPDSLHYVNGKAGLRYKISHLVGRYEKADHYRIRSTDANFMLAALYYLLDDHDASRRYVEKVDDGTNSTRNLQQLILNYG